jgi:FAD/FMN-containing dehydrogenase
MLKRMTPPPGFRGIYREDDPARAMYSESAGIARVIPAAVAVPADADDIVTLVRWAQESGTSLVPRGSGTSMAGGAVGSGVIVDLSRLDGIGNVDVARRRISVGPGAIRGRVNARALEVGLRFPVDPSSGAFCTIGGMVSTNAAGARSLRHGATRPWVTGLDCIFEDGSRAWVRRGEAVPESPAVARFLRTVAPRIAASAGTHTHPGVLKDSSGYGLAAYARSGELVDLLVGSEGTLAIFVGIELGLTDRPGATSSLLAAFGSLEAAVAAAGIARASGASACELLDRTFLDVAAAGGTPLPGTSSAEAVLLAEVEGADLSASAAAARVLERAFRETGATEVSVAVTTEEEKHLWEFRHAASPALSRLDPALASMQFIEDGAVPPERLPDYVRGVRAALDRRGIRGVIFGHAGDGHVHVNPLIDTRLDGWRDRIEAVLDDVATLTAQLGGTLAGEHGDGRLRAPLLDRVWPPETLALFRDVKHAFDPRGILNPGVKVPLEGQRPIGDVKYDPLLPPLPAAARAALDRLVRDRDYSAFRLSLVPGRN